MLKKIQVRVHMQNLGYPLVGDWKYGGPCVAWCPRMFLHSAKVSFRFRGTRFDQRCRGERLKASGPAERRCVR